MIKLRKYSPGDVDWLVELANNEKVSRYLTPLFPHPYTREDAIWWIEKRGGENDQFALAIEFEGKLCGGIGLVAQKGWKNHIVEIGYWLGEPYWGKGLATMAVEKMEREVLPEGKFKKIFAPVLGPNKASMRVLEKNNYKREGILQKEVKKNGEYYDLFHYAKLIR